MIHIRIGLFIYLLTKSCSSLGFVGYPLDDNTDSRTISVCTNYGNDQTYNIYFHEVMHACLHNHQHHFIIKKELQAHVTTLPKQLEEGEVDSLSACMIPALENKDAQQFLGIK